MNDTPDCYINGHDYIELDDIRLARYTQCAEGSGFPEVAFDVPLMGCTHCGSLFLTPKATRLLSDKAKKGKHV